MQPAGLYNKFMVRRPDGRDLPGGDRQHAEYFVLDLSYDKHANAAILAYWESLKQAGEYPELAEDLYERYLRND